MPRKREVIIIAKERPFDEEQWKRLLTAFAYVLHERRKAQGNDAHADTTRHDVRCEDAP